MASQCVLAALLLIVGVCAASQSTRIIGGSATSIENYPSLVQVESSTTTIIWSQECAGSILNSRFVLSAAKCFSGLLFSVSRRRIRAGSSNRNRGGVVFGVTRVLNHPSYSSSTNDGDLTIVELSSAFVYSNTIQSGVIVIHGFELPDNLDVTQVGWGSTRVTGSDTASVVRDVTVQTVNRQLCAERYASLSSPRVITENMLCTGVMGVGERDACNGDEGGPVYFDGIIVGIISWRHACANATMPSVNTRVASYTNWIVINAL